MYQILVQTYGVQMNSAANLRCISLGPAYQKTAKQNFTMYKHLVLYGPKKHVMVHAIAICLHP